MKANVSRKLLERKQQGENTAAKTIAESNSELQIAKASAYERGEVKERQAKAAVLEGDFVSGEHRNRSMPGGANDSPAYCRPSLGLGNTGKALIIDLRARARARACVRACVRVCVSM